MTVEIFYVTHNRRAFAEATFAALVENTNWEKVQRLHVIDDDSTDGTLQFLQEAVRDVPFPVHMTSRKLGGPVAALNVGLDHAASEYVAKIDSDLIVCPGWLDAMLTVIDREPRLDALGMEPGFGDRYRSDLVTTTVRYPVPGEIPVLLSARSWQRARWIGGIGVFRRSVFARQRPRMNDRFFGLTAFWRAHATTGWITPDLPVFLLDHLPMDPWRSLADEYVDRGWARAWPGDIYGEDKKAYWQWWQPADVGAAA